ncbi:GerMN domain-containing protein [Sediminibacillus massiliensis]|uniref:GerMN domain-containing protein n=1 Tax=Sediminibacillus massiliensis TaxID=1926277 RepID=UPI0009883F7C|nr:hypothetical protein [Sediminibacillus massiliensis]
MKKKIDENKLEDLLRDMPAIKDEQERDELYQKITCRMEAEGRQIENKKSKAVWLIPSFATLAVLILAVVIVQSILQEGYYSSEGDTVDYSMTNTEESRPVKENVGKMERNEDGDYSISEEGAEDTGASAQLNNAEEITTPKLIYLDENDETLLTISVPDLNAQYLIPFSIKVKNDEKKIEEVLNNIQSYIPEEVGGASPHPLANLSFDLKQETREVIIDFPEDYTLPPGSSVQSKLETILSDLFLPLDIDQALLQTEGVPGVDLGQIGTDIERFEFQAGDEQGYKIYQYNEQSPERLVPVPLTDQEGNIGSALKEMQKDEQPSGISASIPEAASLVVEQNLTKGILKVSLEGQFNEDQKTLNTVEAILMTAKDFHFQKVELDMGIDQVGPYQLSEPLDIPDGANPTPIEQ